MKQNNLSLFNDICCVVFVIHIIIFSVFVTNGDFSNDFSSCCQYLQKLSLKTFDASQDPRGYGLYQE